MSSPEPRLPGHCPFWTHSFRPAVHVVVATILIVKPATLPAVRVEHGAVGVTNGVCLRRAAPRDDADTANASEVGGIFRLVALNLDDPGPRLICPRTNDRTAGPLFFVEGVS